jgi:murein L,D-transpeptidase YcbB/YkuD
MVKKNYIGLFVALLVSAAFMQIKSTEAQTACVVPSSTYTSQSQCLALGTQINAQIAAISASSAADLQALQNGTIPLNPEQQSVINNMTTQMNNLISAQQSANASDEGAVQENNARSGEEEYSPTNAAAMINKAASNANLSLGALEAQQTQAIAQVQNEDEQENYQAMMTANQQSQNALEANETEQLQDCDSDVQNYQQELQDYQDCTQSTNENTSASGSPAVPSSTPTTPTAAPIVPSIVPLAFSPMDENLQVGASDEAVSALQQFLINNGYLTAVSTPTGYFGNLTKQAVIAFQASAGLPATGYCGPMTRAKINADNHFQ